MHRLHNSSAFNVITVVDRSQYDATLDGNVDVKGDFFSPLINNFGDFVFSMTCCDDKEDDGIDCDNNGFCLYVDGTDGDDTSIGFCSFIDDMDGDDTSNSFRLFVADTIEGNGFHSRAGDIIGVSDCFGLLPDDIDNKHLD